MFHKRTTTPPSNGCSSNNSSSNSHHNPLEINSSLNSSTSGSPHNHHHQASNSLDRNNHHHRLHHDNWNLLNYRHHSDPEPTTKSSAHHDDFTFVGGGNGNAVVTAASTSNTTGGKVNNKFTNFQCFMMNEQARGDLMNYLRRRENDENIVFVDEVFRMKEIIRKVIRMFIYERSAIITNHENIRKSSFEKLNSLVSQLINSVESIHQHYLLQGNSSTGIMLNTSNTILEKARRDYSIFTKIFKSPHSTATASTSSSSNNTNHHHHHTLHNNQTNQTYSSIILLETELLETTSRFCNHLLQENHTHQLHDKDFERLKKILISDECTLDSLNSQINFSEDLDEQLLKNELFCQLRWFPFRELNQNILNQIQLECYDEYKASDEFENFMRRKIQELTSEQMYKLFCQNVEPSQQQQQQQDVENNFNNTSMTNSGGTGVNFVGDYVLSKKKKRRSLVDVILRRRPSGADDEHSHSNTHHHHHNTDGNDGEMSELIGLDPVNSDLREWYYPIAIPKWQTRHLIIFISHYCNFEQQDLEIYCKRIEKKGIVGLDLMCLLGVNGSSSTNSSFSASASSLMMGNSPPPGALTKDTSAQHLFKELKMKNHDHQQRFFSNLLDFNRNRMIMKRRSSIALLMAMENPLQHQSVKDLYVPLVNEDHLIIKVVSTSTDESRVFSIDRNISLESLYAKIEEEFKNSRLLELMEGCLFDLKSLYSDDGRAIRDQFHLFEYLISKRGVTGESLSSSRRDYPLPSSASSFDNLAVPTGSSGRIIGSSYSREDESILVDRASFERSLGDVFGIENSIQEEDNQFGKVELVEPFNENSSFPLPLAVSPSRTMANEEQTKQQETTTSIEDDGFKRLFIRPSCHKKFQRRSVVY